MIPFLTMIALCSSHAQATIADADRDTELVLRAVLVHYARELRDEARICVDPDVNLEPLRVLRTGWSLLKKNEHYALSTRPATEPVPPDMVEALEHVAATAIRAKAFRVRPNWVRKPLRVRPQYDCDIGLALGAPAIRDDFAVVFVRYHCGDGCGGSSLIGIRREGGAWRAFAHSQQSSS